MSDIFVSKMRKNNHKAFFTFSQIFLTYETATDNLCRGTFAQIFCYEPKIT